MIWVNEAGTALYDVEYTVATSDLVEHVGRSLTIHDGPTKESPTIAAATCGLANPNAQLDTTGAPTVGLARVVVVGQAEPGGVQGVRQGGA